MILRVARHTNELATQVKFYTEIIGLDVLGTFENHDGYDGVFLGKEGMNWYLEFTTSKEKTHHFPDADDLLVLYPQSRAAYEQLLDRIARQNIEIIQAKNPYWNTNGKLVLDPDGFGIVISKLRVIE